MRKSGHFWAAAVTAMLAAAPASAEWTADAETCAAHPDPTVVVDACTRALDSGALDSLERVHTLSNRSWAHLERGDRLAARVDLELAISAHPEGGLAASWNRLGVVQEHLGEYDEAEKAYLMALRQFDKLGENISAGDPTDVAARVNLAKFYEDRGRISDAARWVGEAYRYAPDHRGMQDLYRKYGLR